MKRFGVGPKEIRLLAWQANAGLHAHHLSQRDSARTICERSRINIVEEGDDRPIMIRRA